MVTQDSLRYLVQDSLTSYTQMILDSCHSIIELPEEFTWGDNVIKSTYK